MNARTFVFGSVVVALHFHAAGFAAPAVNLAWDDCYAGGAQTNKLDACNTNAGPAHRLIVSVSPNGVIGNVIGAAGVIDVVTTQATPDYWQVYAGGARAGRIAEDVAVGDTSPPFSCSPVWPGSSPVGQAFGSSPSPFNRMRIQWVVQSAAPGATLDPGVAREYYLMSILVLRSGTTLTQECLVPADLVLSDVVLHRPPGHPEGDLAATATDINTIVVWQGAPTPVGSRTWGQVKQLFR